MATDLRLAVALNGYGVSHDEPDGGWTEILSWDDLVGMARLAERLGYEAVFTPEIRGREALATLAGFAMHTERVRLVSGVLPLRSRDIHTLAMGASSLHEMSGGRFVLGLGSDLPIQRTRELVRAVRATIRGDEGLVTDHVDGGVLATGQIDWFAEPRAVPLYLAALGPRMTRLAAEETDGVVLNWCTPDRVRDARAVVGSGRTIAVYVRGCLSPLDERAQEELRWAAARYASMPTYRRQFHAMGLGEEADACAEGRLAPDGFPEGIDRIVEATCLPPERDPALARLADYERAGANLVVVYPVPAGEAVSSITGTLMALAPDPAVEA